jgi:hypothetical protein
MVRKRHGKQKIIEWPKVDEMLACGCNGVEVAATLGICSETLYRRCKADHGVDFVAYLQEKRAVGDKSLHAAQYALALSGNPTMLIWLGKQRLHQREPEQKVSEATKPALTEYLDLLKQHKLAEQSTTTPPLAIDDGKTIDHKE